MPFQPSLPGLLSRPPSCLPPGSHRLWSFPDLPGIECSRHAKILGLAGECLADSMLMRYGLSVMRLPEFSGVDRLILHPDRILRLQIKTTSTRRNGAWVFQIHHGNGRSPKGLRPYDPGAFDLMALVVLPENAVVFTAEARRSIRISDRELTALQRDPRGSLETAFRSLDLAAPDREIAPDRNAGETFGASVIPDSP